MYVCIVMVCDFCVLKIPQVRFYAAELILALEHIHAQNIVYRDLKVCDLLEIHNFVCLSHES